MLRCGKLCIECGDKCKDEGTDAQPIDCECPNCGGHGCEHCDQGNFRVIGCPNRYCSDMAQTTELVDLFHSGMPPVAGGSMDQTVWFIEAARQLKNDEARLKS